MREGNPISITTRRARIAENNKGTAIEVIERAIIIECVVMITDSRDSNEYNILTDLALMLHVASLL